MLKAYFVYPSSLPLLGPPLRGYQTIRFAYARVCNLPSYFHVLVCHRQITKKRQKWSCVPRHTSFFSLLFRFKL